MDVRRHGNPDWQQKRSINEDGATNTLTEEPTSYAKSEDGKTEMSLLHFALTNPDWKPPQEEQTEFIKQLRGQVSREAENLTGAHQVAAATANLNALEAVAEEENLEIKDNLDDNVLYASLNSLDAAGGVYSELANGIMSDAGIQMRSPSHFLHQRRPGTPGKGKLN